MKNFIRNGKRKKNQEFRMVINLITKEQLDSIPYKHIENTT